MFLLFVASASLMASVASAGSCTADNGQACMTSSEVNGYDSLFVSGDPCFMHPSGAGKFCITSQASSGGISMVSCGCDNAGVGDPAPTCDNSGISAFSANCNRQTWYCNKSSDNSMCKYCGTVGDACGKVCSLGVISDADQQLIVDKHNELRALVANGNQSPQPAATDMYKLTWSNELAQLAQAWTSQCIWDHDGNRVSPTFPDGVGQNMAMSTSSLNPSNRDYAGKIQGWFDEVKDMSTLDIAPYSQEHKTGVVGHYTALAWGATTKVGCGWSQVEDGGVYKQYLICNYGPGGNIIGLGTKMYTPGTTASECPNGSENGLCL